MATRLIRIKAPHFVAGLEAGKENGLVHTTTPILKYMRGWRLAKVAQYCDYKGWRYEEVG